MAKKIRQITDGIHQTVFLSELESQLMSTPYFYRLHDIYQSSTVYLSFPCNRTKRYEHSCGVMEVAGKIISSAITNADDDTLDDFFDNVEKHFFKILEKFLKNNTPNAIYCQLSKVKMGNCFGHYDVDEINSKAIEIQQYIYNNPKLFTDMALSHYFPPIYKDVEKRRFLYQLVLESVRLTALFHDVGHPPFSHIIESELTRLYNKCAKKNNGYVAQKVSYFKTCLDPYLKNGCNKINLISGSGNGSSDLHEIIGLKMFNLAYDDMLYSTLDTINNLVDVNEKVAVLTYYVILAEFCNLIMCEKDDFYTSLHRIIDGCIDADRMDYVVRDTLNSGVNWGGVPYKRILESSRLSIKNTEERISNNKNKKHKFYVIAFHRKMVEDIDDFLLTRYKIFSRVNYHHKSFKTGLILQKIVRELSDDYLSKKDDEHVLCPEIKSLWAGLWISNNSKTLNVIQWNDSTLIANLYKTLVDMNENCQMVNQKNTYYNISEIQFNKILFMLEEFLLNQKHYQAVFKRPSDLIVLLNKIIKKYENAINNIINYESNKIKNSSNVEDKDNATDSLRRLSLEKLEKIVSNGDINGLETLLATDIRFEDIIKNALDKEKNDGKIITYFFDSNVSWGKLGLPKKKDGSDQIYLYNSKDDDIVQYNTSNLENQLREIQKNCLRYIAYVYPTDVNNTKKIIDEILQEVEKNLSSEIKNALSDKFTDSVNI